MIILALKVKVFYDRQCIQRIYEMKHSGLGNKAICKVLNSEGVKSPRPTSGKGYWHPSTIRSMISNKKYTGIWEYNKTRWIKKRVDGLRKVIPNPKDKWVKFESEKLRIVSDELFFSVNSKIKSQGIQNRRGKKKYLLSGLLKCSDCGGSMIVNNSGKYSGYVCNNARSLGPSICKNKHSILRSDVESALMSNIMKSILNDELITEIIQQSNQIIESQQKGNRKDLGSLQQTKNKLTRQIENLLNMAEEGNYSDAIQSRLKSREIELDELNSKIKLATKSPDSIIKASNEWIKSRLSDVRSMIDGRESRCIQLRNQLQHIFPEKLSVTPHKMKHYVGFRIQGNANPLGLFDTGFLVNKVYSGTGNRTPV